MAQLQKVQMVHNSAPRLITGKCRREHNYQGLAIQYNKLDTDSIFFPIGDRVNVSNAVCKLTILKLLQHHTLLHVISRNYCQVFIKSLFYKIHMEDSTCEKSYQIETKLFMATCYGNSSVTRVPLCYEAPIKITFSTISVLVRLNVPISLFREPFLRQQKSQNMVPSQNIPALYSYGMNPQVQYWPVPNL